MPESAEVRDFFVSYNGRDRPWAEWIGVTLRELGYSVILQAWDFRPGDNFVLRMHEALQRTRATILVLSRNYLGAEFTHPEWAATFRRDPRARGRQVLPLRIDDCEPTGLLGAIVYADLVGLDEAQARERIRDAVAEEPVVPSRVAFPGDTTSAPVAFPRHDAPLAIGAGGPPAALTRPGLVGTVLDRVCPRLHSWLIEIGTRPAPPELKAMRRYLGAIKAEVEHGLRDQLYLPLAARARDAAPSVGTPSDRDAPAAIRQEVRQLLELSRGGDGAGARLAGIGRRSRGVRNILATVLRADTPIVLLGEPGSGKTMTLQQVVRTLADSELRRAFPRLVVYRRLGEFHVAAPAVPGPEHVLEHLRGGLPPTLRPQLEALLAAGRIVALFDGMDEMSRERYGEHVEALSRFALQHQPRVKSLFTCRVNDFSPRFLHRQLVLQPFDRRRLERYLHGHIAEFPIAIDGEALTLRRLANRLEAGDLPLDAGNPFVLWLLCFHLNQAHAWPASRAALLASYVERVHAAKHAEAAAGEPALAALPELTRGLALIAYTLADLDAGTAVRGADLVSAFGADDAGWQALHRTIHAGRRCGFLVEVPAADGTRIRFAHHRLQEYFAALHIAESDPPLDWLDKLDAPRWQETIANLAAMGRGERAVRALADSIRTGLAARPVADTSRTATAAAHVQAEPLLADRVELGTRLAKEAHNNAAVRDLLLAPVVEAVSTLAATGNPGTQVKMLWASRHLDAATATGVASLALGSPIAWVRLQALAHLTRSGIAARAPGRDVIGEIALDLARCRILPRWPQYWRAFATALPRERAALAAASAGEAILHAAIFVAALIAILRFGGNPHQPILDIPAAPLAAFVALSLAIGIRYTPAHLWAWAFGAAWVFAAGYDAARVGLGGDLSRFVGQAMGIAAGLVVMLPIGAAIACLTHGIVLGAFALVSRRIFDRRFGLRPWLATAWHTSTYLWAIGVTLLAIPIVNALFEWLADAIFGSLVGTFTAINRSLQAATSWFGLYVAGPLGAVLAIVYFARRKLRHSVHHRGVGAASAVLLAMAVAQLVPLMWDRLASSRLGPILAIALTILWLALAALALSWIVVLVARPLLRRRRPYPAGSFTPDSWLAQLAAADAEAQAELLRRTNRDALGVDLVSFLDTLRSAEPRVKTDPAASAYWAKRHEIEQALRQERQG